MFNAKNTRTHLIVITVAVMLVLAGCSTGTSSSTKVNFEPQEQSTPTTVAETTVEAETETTEAEEVETVEPEYGPDVGQNLTEYSDDLGAGAAGLTSSEQKTVENLVVEFYDDLPDNESDRRQIFLRSADELCKFEEKYEGDVSTSMLEEGGKTTDDTVRRAHYAAQIANEFNGEVPVEPLGDIRSGMGDVTKYAPLLGSYNQMSDTACAASAERTDAAIKDYQMATLMFGVDTVLISTGAFYQPAFAGTRFTANKASQLGLYRLRHVCGDRCWALAMSEVHVALRGSMVTGTSNLLKQAGEMGVELDREDLEAVADEYDTDVDSMLEDVDSSVTSEALGSVSDDVVECGEALEKDEEENESDDDGILSGGINTEDVVEKGEDVLNKSTEMAEECRNATDK